MDRVCVSVDPGVVTMGFAVWDAKRWESRLETKRTCPRPIAAGTLNARHGRMNRDNGGGGEQAALKLVEWLESKVHQYRVEQVWCEKMEFRSTHVGIAAVDDVMDVSFACGAIAQMARGIGAAFHPARVSEWKGNMSKVQMARRILKRWQIEEWDEGLDVFKMLSDPADPSHDWDAVGIGLFAQGWI